jgi:hypothetical protein
MSQKDLRETPAHHEQPDVWHRHTPEEGMPQVEHAAHVSYTWLFVAGALGVIAVAATTVLIIIYFKSSASQYRMEAVETTVWAAEFLEARRSDMQKLDAAAGTTEMPIDDAIDAVVAEYREARASGGAGGGGDGD